MKKFSIFLGLFFVFCGLNGVVPEFFIERDSTVKESDFEEWVVKTTDDLFEDSKIILTSMGPVQYVLKGKGPIVLSLHGGFGGWDQGLLISSFLIKKGFSVLSPSRPGYIGTPLPPLQPFEELTASQQADIMKALLDALNIDKVVALGFSAGGPVAYELAKKYPDRVSCTVLESIGASPNEGFFFYSALEAILTEPVIPDFITYLVHLSTKKDFYSTSKIVLGADTSLQGKELDERIKFVTVKSPNQFIFCEAVVDTCIPLTPRLPGTLNDFKGVQYWTTNFSPVGYSKPTLIIQAINDTNGFFPTAQLVQSQLPTSRLIPVRLSGHLIWLGPQTDSWEEQLIKFLREHT